jgi:chromosome segregation ATPase
MDVKTHGLDRLLEALSPSLEAELDRVARETRENVEQEFRTRLDKAVHEAETAAAAARANMERAVEEAKAEARRQITAELEQQFAEKLAATTAQLQKEAGEERARLEAKLEDAVAQVKNEWSSELNKVEDERNRFRAYAEAQKQLSESTSQAEMLSRFVNLAQPFAENLAIYVSKADGLALWKSKGKGAFPKIVSPETTDPDSYFRILSVRGKTVGAICAAPAFQADALEFLSGTLEYAIEAFGLKLRAGPKPVAADSR